jgi:hypothetical protein
VAVSNVEIVIVLLPEVLLPTQAKSGLEWATCQRLRTVEDSGQLIAMFAFAVEGASNRGEGLGERKNVGRNKQIGIFRPDRMPVHTLSGNRDFRH